jgi:hypothetical protein
VFGWLSLQWLQDREFGALDDVNACWVSDMIDPDGGGDKEVKFEERFDESQPYTLVSADA